MCIWEKHDHTGLTINNISNDWYYFSLRNNLKTDLESLADKYIVLEQKYIPRFFLFDKLSLILITSNYLIIFFYLIKKK